VGLGIIRLDGNCPAVTGGGLGQLASVAQRVAQIGMGLGKIGLQLQGAAVSRNRLVPLPQCAVCFAEIVGVGRYVGAQRHCPRKEIGAELRPAGLALNYSQQVQCIGVLWLPIENLPINLCGLRHFARAVTAGRRREKL
jgi:hypothetical protein